MTTFLCNSSWGLFLVLLVLPFLCFGWATYAWLNHRVSIFRWSIERDARPNEFLAIVVGIGLAGIGSIIGVPPALVNMIEVCEIATEL